MTDIVSKDVRSRMMSCIRSKNTKPELLVRKGLFALGFRYRLHDSKLPGRPDMVFHKYKSVVFVNGCFWHGHNCRLFKYPESNSEFWHNKIEKNKNNDNKNRALLTGMGWKVVIVWECSIKNKNTTEISVLMNRVSRALQQLPHKSECLDF